MKRFVFLPLFLILLCSSCGHEEVGTNIIKSVLMPDPVPEWFQEDFVDFIIPPVEIPKNLEPDIVLETDRKSGGRRGDGRYPIFDNLEAAITSLKVKQEYVAWKCGPTGRGTFVGEPALRYKVMECQILVGSLVFGDCMLRERLSFHGYGMLYTAGFTSRALRDAFIASIPHLIDEDEWWLQIIGEKRKAGSYILRKDAMWVTRISEGLRGHYRGPYRIERTLEIALPDDFPVFFVSFAGTGLKDDACRRNKLGMDW